MLYVSFMNFKNRYLLNVYTLFANLNMLYTWGPLQFTIWTPFIFHIFVIKYGWLGMVVRKFSFAPIEAKIQLFKSYCYPIYLCALWRHSYQNSIRKLTVILVTLQASYKRPQIHQLESGICD